jgi:hypothetical protein
MHIDEGLTGVGEAPAYPSGCWDIVGKVCGRPVSALLGGLERDRARCST